MYSQPEEVPGALARGDVTMVTVATRRDMSEAAALLRRLLALIDSGELDAGSGHAQAMVRRIEGAAVALESAAR